MITLKMECRRSMSCIYYELCKNMRGDDEDEVKIK